MEIDEHTVIGDIVAADYRAAEVFKQNGLDFCCHGNRSIADACTEQHLPAVEIIRQLKDAIQSTGNATVDFTSWPLDLLADYIEKKHHRYVTAQLPVISQYLDKIVQVHGDRHPELAEIQSLFAVSVGEFTMHMKKEELMLFPFIRKMVALQLSGRELPPPAFGTVQHPVKTMMHEHDEEGERFAKMAALSDNFTPPADGCNTYRVTFKLLQEFRDDLFMHIHLENNILFPKAVELEESMKRP